MLRRLTEQKESPNCLVKKKNISPWWWRTFRSFRPYKNLGNLFSVAQVKKMARNFKMETEYLRVLITRIQSTKDNYNLKYVCTKRTIISLKSYNSLHKDKKSFLGNHLVCCTCHCVWHPTKKGQWVVHVCSIGNFVTSWLKWLQMIWNGSKWVSMCLKNQLKSFEFI